MSAAEPIVDTVSGHKILVAIEGSSAKLGELKRREQHFCRIHSRFPDGVARRQQRSRSLGQAFQLEIKLRIAKPIFGFTSDKSRKQRFEGPVTVGN